MCLDTYTPIKGRWRLMGLLFLVLYVPMGIVAGAIVLYDRLVGFEPPSPPTYSYGPQSFGSGASRSDFDLANLQRHMAKIDKQRKRSERLDASPPTYYLPF
jgi:hypothetical protein